MFALGTLKYQKRSVLEVAFARVFYDEHLPLSVRLWFRYGNYIELFRY